jgi:hypothetical protein
MDTVIHCAMKYVKVCAADAAVCNANLHLAGSGRDRGAVAHPDGLISFVKCRSHENRTPAYQHQQSL